MVTPDSDSIRWLYNHTLRPMARWTFGDQVNMYNGVAVLDRAATDIGPIKKEEKPTMRAAIGKAIHAGDTVVEVATGFGIMATWAVRHGAVVETYEGSKQMYDKAADTFRLNDVADKITQHHAIVGEPVDVWGEVDGVEVIPPEELPPCDVLLLDCEGAEVNIIDGLSFTPRELVVETHPRKGKGLDEVLAAIGRCGLRPYWNFVMDHSDGEKNAIVAERGA